MEEGMDYELHLEAAGEIDQVQYLEAEHNYLAQLNDEQLKKQAAKCILHMRGIASVPTSAVTDMVHCSTMLFQDVVGSLEENVKAFLGENNIDMQSDSVHELMTRFQCLSNPFIGLETPFQQTKYLKENMKMIPPIPIAFGTRYDQYVDKLSGTVKQKLVTETFQYVPLLETLQCVLTCDTLRLVNTETSEGNKRYSGFVDSEQYLLHPLFKEHPKALRIHLYYDDVELANPLGSKNTIHKLGLFYFSIDNLPRKSNSSLDTVHLVAVCHAIDLKKYGFDPFLKPFVDEIAKLESDSGVKLQLSQGPTTIHGTLVSVVGDTLALHGMFGLLSPSADKLCRMCLAKREDIQSKFTQDQFTMRQIETHDSHVEEARRMHNGNSTTGVKTACILNELGFFHTTTNYNFDIMHDLLEGICPYEVKLLLHYCICVEGVITLDEFNHRLKSFSYQYIDGKNKPSELSRHVLTNLVDHKLRQHASQMWCLIRMLPLLIGDKVPVGNPHYKLLLLLLRCMDIIFSPSVLKSQVLYLKHLIVDHHDHFKYLYPNYRLINKHHHMIHYPTCIELSGPLSSFSCFKYEAKNNFSKTIGHINCNFRNISKSVATKHQIHHASAYSTITNKQFECSTGDMVSVQALAAHRVISDFIGIDVTEVFIAKTVKLFGTSYRANLLLLVKWDVTTHEPCFALIEHIIVMGQRQVYFVVREYNTLDFVPHYHAYTVKTSNPPLYAIVQPSALLDHLPYSFLQSYDDNDKSSYINMRYVT